MNVNVPQVGESVFEATIAKWHVKDGDRVAKDDLLCELETDKITLEIHAETDGPVSLQAAEGATVKVGETIARIDGKEGETEPPLPPEKKEEPPKAETKQKDAEARAAAAPKHEENKEQPEKAAPAAEPPRQVAALPQPKDDERVRRVPMTSIRRRIAAHLLAARQQTAMLTTFNEADMSRLQQLRRSNQERFQQKHGVKLGLMSLFVKAAVTALQEYPEVNARIDGNDIVYQDFYDIGVAIGAEKGLVVPVLRSVERLSCAEIEKQIHEFGDRIASNKLTLAELEGGTFTISNGGVYGSLLSTPIINPPQTGVLGMHAILDRPVAVDGEVVIRPMMNLALSYDHRLVDGRQAVGFLKRIKRFIEEVDEGLLDL